MIKKTASDYILDTFVYLVMIFAVIVAVFPIWYIIVASFSDPTMVSEGKVLIWIKEFTLESYKTVVHTKNLWTSYGNTVFYSFVGTFINMVLTVLCAYAISKSWMPGRKTIIVFLTLSMWFSPGMMANYINYKDLGLIDSRIGILLIGAINTYNVILMRSFFESIPEALEESALLDGAYQFQVLYKIYLPLSTAAIMTISLYYFVGHWNAYFWSMLLLRDEKKIPLQVLLKRLIVQMNVMYSESANMDYTATSRETVVYATMVVSVIPMLAVYPFVQKFFEKGVMLGAVKG